VTKVCSYLESVAYPWPSLFPDRQSNQSGGAIRGVTLDHGLLIPNPHTRTVLSLNYLLAKLHLKDDPT